MRRAPWVLALVVATWSTWWWVGRRALDGSDEPWGLVAVAALLVMLLRAKPVTAPRGVLVPASLGLMAHAVSYPFLPPLLRGVLATTALALLLAPLYRGRRFHLGLWGLCVLTLPLDASLQFYVGYPLRAVVTRLAAGWLRLAGMEVNADGAALRYAGPHGLESVMVDAPCAGIRMLWVGALVTCLLCCQQRIPSPRQLALAVAATAIVMLANTLRATALFYSEAGLVPLPAWGHGGTGLLVFLLALVAIGATARRLATPPPPVLQP